MAKDKFSLNRIWNSAFEFQPFAPVQSIGLPTKLPVEYSMLFNEDIE